MNITASDKASLLRLASSLPAGDETRRAILSGLQRVSAEEKVQVLNENGRKVWVSKETLSGPDKAKYKPLKDEGEKKPAAKAPAHLSSALGKHKKLFESFVASSGMSQKALDDEGTAKDEGYGKWSGNLPAAIEEFSAEHPEEADEVMVAWASKKTGISKAKLQDVHVFQNSSRGFDIDLKAARK